MLKKITVMMFLLFVTSVASATVPPGTYFDWGQGRNGFGYCYEFTWDGWVLNNGRPVPNQYCEYNRPSFFNWGRGRDGYTYCYQFTPYGVVMNEGKPVSNYYCGGR